MMRVHVTVVQALELFQKSLLKLYGHPDEDVAKANWKHLRRNFTVIQMLILQLLIGTTNVCR